MCKLYKNILLLNINTWQTRSCKLIFLTLSFSNIKSMSLSFLKSEFWADVLFLAKPSLFLIGGLRFDFHPVFFNQRPPIWFSSNVFWIGGLRSDFNPVFMESEALFIKTIIPITLNEIFLKYDNYFSKYLIELF